MRDSRAAFGEDQLQKIRAARSEKQNQYFISHDSGEVVLRSNIKLKHLLESHNVKLHNLSGAEIAKSVKSLEKVSRICFV